jgi:DNA-binding response OmpR family regulator
LLTVAAFGCASNQALPVVNASKYISSGASREAGVLVKSDSRTIKSFGAAETTTRPTTTNAWPDRFDGSGRRFVARVGVLEDEESTRWLLSCYVMAGNFRAVGFTCGDQALAAVSERAIDALLVDLGLNGEDGIDVIKAIRQVSDIVVIVVSSNNLTSEVARAFDAGADDFICKPAKVADLVERVTKCLSRRIAIDLHDDDFEPSPEPVRIHHRIVGPSGEVKLTSVEGLILKMLLDSKGQVVPREALARLSAGFVDKTGSRTLDVHISRLRQKLKSAGILWRLRSVRNKGYLISGFELVWQR